MILLYYLESMPKIHKRMEGQCGIIEKSTDFEVSSGMNSITHWPCDLGQDT